MKKFIYKTLALATLVSVASCSDSDEIADNPNNNAADHEMISFSLSDGTGTRAGFTGAETSIAMRIQGDDRTSTTANPIAPKYTKTIATASKDGTGDASSYSTVTFSDAYIRYWDDAFGRKTLLSVYAVAVPNTSSTLTNNGNTLEGLLTAGDTSNKWGANSTNTIAWKVTTDAQTLDAETATPTAPEKTIGKEDLVYSNNIKKGGLNGIYRWNYNATGTDKYDPTPTGVAEGHHNGQMLFFQNSMTDDNAATATLTDAPGKFDKGHLIFNHALSRITVELERGTGFSTTEGFDFATDENITLIGLPTAGTLDIAEGTWSGLTTNVEIKKMAGNVGGSVGSAASTFVAQMLPTYKFTDGNNTNVMRFTIDNNTYYITQDMIFDALTAAGATLAGQTSPIEMQQGKNYKFKMKVNKTKIENITASVVAWDDITAEEKDLHNSYITISGMKDLTGTLCRSFNLYRSAVVATDILTDQTTSTAAAYENYAWGGNYTEKASLTETGTNTNVWKTDWTFADNKTFYHFRSVSNDITTINGTNDTTDDYFEITSGAEFASDGTTILTDPHWGAPMRTLAGTETLTYNPNANTTENPKQEGYSAYIYKAIGSTESTIKIQEVHLMSKIYVVLKTTTNADDTLASDAVKLYDDNGTTEDKTDDVATVVTLKNFYEKANVKMGNGFITPINTANKTQSMTAPSSYYATNKIKTKEYSWCVVPQLVNRGAGNGTVGITITTPDGNEYYINDLSDIALSGSTTKIERWLPNHTYTYTFTLSKTKIEEITASVADWVNVTAADIPIDLEK